MRTTLVVLCATTVLGLVASGCGREPVMQSGKYLCESDRDCDFGWQCLPSEQLGGAKACFAPDQTPPQQDASSVPAQDGGSGGCTPGADQSCNDNPEASALWGVCNADGTCRCNPGFAINPQTGKCRPAVADGGTAVCAHLCDCPQGWFCNGSGVCEDGTQMEGTPFCCENAGCVSGAPCVSRDGTASTCGSTRCTPNTSQCLGLGAYVTCNADGTDYLPPENCLAGHRCENGACVAAGRVAAQMVFGVMLQHSYWPGLGEVDLYSGGLGAGFWYDAPAPSDYTPPPIETCQFEPFGTAVDAGVPFDAGNIAVTGIPSGLRTLLFNCAGGYGSGCGYDVDPPLAEWNGTDSLDPSEIPWGQTLSFSGPGANLIPAPLGGTIPVPPQRLLDQPARLADITKGQPLRVTWTGGTGVGTVRIDVLDNPASGASSYVTCLANDDGEFIVPGTFTAGFHSDMPGHVVLNSTTAGTFAIQGVDEASAGGWLLHDREVWFR